MLLYSIGHLWLHPVALISLLYLLPLVIGFSNLNCASRHSRNFNVYAALYDMTSTELWLISSTEVVRISNTMVINTSPPVIQIGRVAAQKHALSAEVLSRDNIIGLFSIESSIYLATNQKGSARKVTIFREIRRQSFETKSVKSEGYFSELKKTLSGANTLAKLGDRMMVVLSGPESIASTFYRLVYTSDKLGVEQHSKRQNSLNLIGLTQIKPKSANDNFFYMLGFSPNNVMKIFAIDRDYTKDNLQSIGWSGRAFGCYRTLCEGAKINAIFYDEKFKKHLLIADGGLITLENLFNINGDLIPIEPFASEIQYLTTPVGVAFIHSDVKYTYWNGTINLVAIENGRLKYTGLGPQEMIARFQILEDNQLKLTAAVQLGSKLLLFMGHQYMFYDDLTVENSKKLKEKLMFTNMLFKTREPVTVQTVYFDAKTSNYLFVCSLSYFSVPTSLVDADKSQFYTAIPELTLDNMYSCGAQAQAVLTDEAKWAAIAIMCTLAFILLVVLGVFCQISHRKRRARTRNRPSSSNMRKWSKSNVSSTGSSVASRTSSMVSRSQVASSASSVSGTGSAVASSASRR